MSKRPVLDQTAHTVAGAILVSPVLFWQNPITGAWATFCAGMVREYTEWQLDPRHGPSPFSGPGAVNSSGSREDLFYWTLIGFVLGWIPLAMRWLT